jgi:hypothetical protein
MNLTVMLITANIVPNSFFNRVTCKNQYRSTRENLVNAC